MAKKKAKKAPKRKFYIGSSECGKMEQFEVFGDLGPFPSVEAAKRLVDKEISSGEWEVGGGFFIVEVVAAGRSKTLTWE